MNDEVSDIMKILFDETYPSSDGSIASRNIWYGYADISVDDQYRKTIKLSEEFVINLCQIIKNDLAYKSDNPPTETNWYFYGNSTTKDAIGDLIRPTIMIREKSGGFIANFSISDYDFARNIDAIVSYRVSLEEKLSGR